MDKAKPSGAGAALADQLDRQRIAALVRSAEQKLRNGEVPNARETAALKKFEREQLDRWGSLYISAMPKGDYARMSGRQSKQLIEAADNYGLPYRPDSKTVDVGRMLRWFHDFLAANAGMLAGGSSDDAILHLASKELKDEFVRVRINEKNIDTERKRIELAHLADNYVPIEPLRQYHNELAGLIKRLRMKFAKRFEGQEKEFVERSFEDLNSEFDQLAESHFNDGNATDIDTANAAGPAHELAADGAP